MVNVSPLASMLPWLRKFCGSIVMLPLSKPASMVPRLMTAFWSLPAAGDQRIGAVLGDDFAGPSVSVPAIPNAADTSRVPPRDSGVLLSVWVPLVTMFSTPSSVICEAAKPPVSASVPALIVMVPRLEKSAADRLQPCRWCRSVSGWRCSVLVDRDRVRGCRHDGRAIEGGRRGAEVPGGWRIPVGRCRPSS